MTDRALILCPAKEPLLMGFTIMQTRVLHISVRFEDSETRCVVVVSRNGLRRFFEGALIRSMALTTDRAGHRGTL